MRRVVILTNPALIFKFMDGNELKASAPHSQVRLLTLATCLLPLLPTCSGSNMPTVQHGLSSCGSICRLRVLLCAIAVAAAAIAAAAAGGVAVALLLLVAAAPSDAAPAAHAAEAEVHPVRLRPLRAIAS